MQPVDDAESRNIEKAIGRLQALNHDFWALVREYGYPA